MGKIGELLSDGESVKQLSELAQMLMSESNASDASETNDDSEKPTENSDEGLVGGGFDIGLIMKLQEIMGVMNQKDKNSELLLALKPHLRDNKQEKVDKAIKILKLLAVWNIVKDSGLLQDLL